MNSQIITTFSLSPPEIEHRAAVALLSLIRKSLIYIFFETKEICQCGYLFSQSQNEEKKEAERKESERE